jgi:uncharacterized integral membrane protein
MRGLRWWRWGALLLVGVLAALFASLNAGERVALYLGFATLYQIPLVPLILGAFVVGMATMFLLGLRHDLHVRKALRDAGFGEPIAPGESAVTRGGWAASAVEEERPPGTDDDRTLSVGAAGPESDSAPAVPPGAPRPAILSGHEMPTPQHGVLPHESAADELPLPSNELTLDRLPSELLSHEPPDKVTSDRLPPELQAHESPDEVMSDRLPPELQWHETPDDLVSDRLPSKLPPHESPDRLPSDKLPPDGAGDKEADDAPRSGDVANQPQDSEELPPDVHSQPRSPP